MRLNSESVQHSVLVNSNDHTSDHASVQISVQVKRLLIAKNEDMERIKLQEILKK